jgi:hypothetical protein
MHQKRVAICRVFLLALLSAGCCWAIKAMRGPFDMGPQGETPTQEFTHNDNFGFDAETDSVVDDEFGGADDGYASEDASDDLSQSIDAGVSFTGPEQSGTGTMFDSAHHTHATNYYEPGKKDDADEGFSEPVHHHNNYYEKKPVVKK